MLCMSVPFGTNENTKLAFVLSLGLELPFPFFVRAFLLLFFVPLLGVECAL